MNIDLDHMAPLKKGIFEGRMLVALPASDDGGCFGKSLIYVCAHSSEGAIGVIVNQSMPMVEFDDLEEQIGLPSAEIIVRPKVYFGGPIETSRGFVIHSRDYSATNSMPISDALALNSTVNILKSIALGQGPEKSLFVLGYAGWDAGQLEDEVLNNFWLTLECDEDLLFSQDVEMKWHKALSKLGVSPEHLTGATGHA